MPLYVKVPKQRDKLQLQDSSEVQLTFRDSFVGVIWIESLLECPNAFLTVAEVAELLKLNRQNIRTWIDQSSLPSVPVWRRVPIKRSDLGQLIETGYTGGKAALADKPGGWEDDVTEPHVPSTPFGVYALHLADSRV